MPEVTIRRPFGELDLGNQLGSPTDTNEDNRRLDFDRWKINPIETEQLFSRLHLKAPLHCRYPFTLLDISES